MSLPVKLDTSDLCGSHDFSARVFLVGSYSGIVLSKIWPCGGVTHAFWWDRKGSKTGTNFQNQETSPIPSRVDLRRSQDRFLRQKIERFFWRDFSGEELLPENSFLGQRVWNVKIR